MGKRIDWRFSFVAASELLNTLHKAPRRTHPAPPTHPPAHPTLRVAPLILPPADLLDEPDVELLQNMSCKVDAATLKPADYPENPEMEW